MIAKITPEEELSKLDDALKQLRKLNKQQDGEELAEIADDLARTLGKVARKKLTSIIERQQSGEDVDGRAFGAISTALEKITRTVDSMSKRRRDRIEEQKAIVDAEADRIKTARGGTDLSDIAKILFPHQGNNRRTASPIIAQLNATNVVVDSAIDADCEEIVDEELPMIDNTEDARKPPDTNPLPNSLA